MLKMLQLLLHSLFAVMLCRLCTRTLLHSSALCCAGTGHQHLGCAEDSGVLVFAATLFCSKLVAYVFLYWLP